MADEGIPLEDFSDRTPLLSADDDIATTSLSTELLTGAVDGYYDNLGEGYPAAGKDYQKFEIDEKGQLRLRAHPDVDLVKGRDGKPLKLTTIAGKKGGRTIIREELGFSNWSGRKTTLPAEAVTQIQQADGVLGEAAGGSLEVAVVDRATHAVTEAEETVLKTINDPPLSTSDLDRSELVMRYRELQGLDKAMRTQRGELVNNLARLSELDRHIDRENRKLGETDDEQQQREIRQRIADLNDERAARLEAASTNREALRSQISRVRGTLRRMMHEDTTLAERIKTLFREQGITVVSILTAIGMTISTLVLALTGGGSGAGGATPPAPTDKGGVKEWVKKQLKALATLLGKLAGKAAAAIPGIIGSVVSWLLSTAGKAVGWLAEHTWALFLAVGGLVLVAAREWLAKR